MKQFNLVGIRLYIIILLSLLSVPVGAQSIIEILDASEGDGAGNTLNLTRDIVLDGSDNIYVIATNSDNAFKISPSGTITEIIDATGDGAGNTLQGITDINVDNFGNIYIVATNSRNAFKITPGGVITEIIDVNTTNDVLLSSIQWPSSITADNSGNVYFSDSIILLKITPAGAITKLIDYNGDGTGNITSVIDDITVDNSGNIYLVGTFSHNAFKITPSGIITQIIDNSGDGAGNELENPNGIAVDDFGNVYVCGYLSHNAFKITPSGVITEIINSYGDGMGNRLWYPSPSGIAVDEFGIVYVTGQSKTFKIIPSNLIPVVDAGVDQTVDEGDMVSLAPATFTNGPDDNHTAIIDWGDGSQIEDGTVDQLLKTVSGSHLYTENGTYSVTVTISYNDIASSSDIFIVTVNNIAPVVNAGADQEVNEGDMVSLAPATFTNGPGDAHTATIDWGDGTPADAGTVDETAKTVSGSHIYSDNGVYTVTVSVTDDETATGSDVFMVTVNNVAPTVVAGSDQTINEGATLTLAPATLNDKGTSDTHTATIDWGDGSPVEAGTVTETPSGPPGSTAGTDGTVAGSHIYVDNGDYTVTVTVSDDDGGVSTGSFLVTVAAVNNHPIADAGGPYEAEEGGTVEVIASGNDPDNDLLTFTWDLDNDGIFETIGATVTFSAEDLDGPSTHTIKLKVTDSSGLSDIDETTVSILNVASVVREINAPIDPVNLNDEVSVNVSFTDNGLPDTHTAEWSWGDETTSPGIVEEENGSGIVSGSHTYLEPGVYTVTVIVIDDDNGASEPVFQYIVVYDPDGGFVTGGGWINSPEGAYTADPSLTGKANFGFVSKYKKGKSVPEGSTQFNFKVANLNFSSTIYDWMIISGPNARYKGSGCINGVGDYGFMITAKDGDVYQEDKVDRFRIKIWEKNTEETIIYDNQIGDEDFEEATDAIEGGSIVIHKKAVKVRDTDLIGEFNSIPSIVNISQNYPNPFNPETKIHFQIPDERDVLLTIYNIFGQKIRTLTESPLAAGFYTVRWDGKNDLGDQVSTGTYIYKFRAGDFIQMKKMNLIR